MSSSIDQQYGSMIDSAMAAYRQAYGPGAYLPSRDYFLSIIAHESGGNANTKPSSTGAQGLCQVLPSTARGIVNKNSSSFGDIPTDTASLTTKLMDPSFNIKTAVFLTGENYQAAASAPVSGDARDGYASIMYMVGPGTNLKSLLKDAGYSKDNPISDRKKLAEIASQATFTSGSRVGENAFSVCGNGNIQAIANRAAGTSKVNISAATTTPSISLITQNLWSDTRSSQLVGTSTSAVESYIQDQARQDLLLQKQLDSAPWYSRDRKKSTYVGNPKLSGTSSSMYFQLFMDNNDTKLLSDSQGKPIEVRLNTNLSRVSEHMRHVSSKKNTSTGFAITLWGQELDELSGSGTTGVFMNRFGLTSFPSSSMTSGEIQGLLSTIMDEYNSGSSKGSAPKSLLGSQMASFQKWQASNADKSEQKMFQQQAFTILTNAGETPTTDSVQQLSQRLQRLYGSRPNTQSFDMKNNTDLLRVAAEDAFMELLMLFKNNGVRRFLPKDYGSPT